MTQLRFGAVPTASIKAGFRFKINADEIAALGTDASVPDELQDKTFRVVGSSNAISALPLEDNPNRAQLITAKEEASGKPYYFQASGGNNASALSSMAAILQIPIVTLKQSDGLEAEIKGIDAIG